MDDKVARFLHVFVEWGKEQPKVAALALVGSHARSEGRPDSDVDLLILGDSAALLADAGWAARFGDVRQLTIEDYGAVTSLRVHYSMGGGPAAGLEVEYGIGSTDWAQVPLDSGSAEVISGGILILHDPHQLIASALASLAT